MFSSAVESDMDYLWLLASPSDLPPALLRCLKTTYAVSSVELRRDCRTNGSDLSRCQHVLSRSGRVYSKRREARKEVKNPPGRTPTGPIYHHHAALAPRSSPATMSPSAIFVFLLVSAVHMLECILDLKRRVGANCQENPALSFLSLSCSR